MTDWKTVSLDQLNADALPTQAFVGATRWRDTVWVPYGRTNRVYDYQSGELLGERSFGPEDVWERLRQSVDRCAAVWAEQAAFFEGKR